MQRGELALLCLALLAGTVYATHPAPTFPKCVYRFRSKTHTKAKLQICWNGLYGDTAVATYTWTIIQVAGYYTGAVGVTGYDMLKDGYAFGQVIPSLTAMDRMTLKGGLLALFGGDLIAMSEALYTMCQSNATVAVVTGSMAAPKVNASIPIKPPFYPCPEPAPGTLGIMRKSPTGLRVPGY